MAEIALGGKRGRGKVALVDDADIPLVSGYRWHFSPHGYAYARPYLGNYRKATIYMHRLILDPPGEFQTDHANRNKLDNRRVNLRVATVSQNRANKNIAPGRIKGIKKERSAATWQARIKVNQKTICLGNFRTPEQAALAYNEAAKLHFGEFAVLNAL